MKTITDIQDPQILEFISLRQSSLDERYVVIESKNVFKKLFKTNIKIYKVFSTIDNLKFIEEHCPSVDFPIYTASNELMKKIVGHKIHQGLMALIDKPSFINFEDIDGDIIVLNGLTSPENVGSIVRSCAAFNIKTMIIDEKTCSPFLRRCIRVSTGNIFNINVYKSSNLKQDLTKLSEDGYSILSTANSPKAINLQKFTFPKKNILIIGSEGDGVDREILNLSNTILKIDINDEVTSLNASIAAAIILYGMNSQTLNKTSL